MLPPLPAGSIIQVEPAGDGWRLAWAPPRRPGGRAVPVVFLLVWLAGWLVALVAAAGMLLKAEAPVAGRIFILVWLVLWSLGGLAALRALRQFAEQPRPENLALGRAELLWTPAHPRSQVRRRAGVRASGGAEIILRRDAIRDVKLEERTVAVHGRTPVPPAARVPRPVLRITTDEGVFGPGRGLSPDETRWLAALLQSWWKS